MKATSLIVLTIAATLSLTMLPSANAISLTPEFITGFESGIFLRDGSELDNYGCPEAKPSGPF